MKYFSQEFIRFFHELERNNSKDWFDNNRKTYETQVKEPFSRFVSELIIAISQFDDSINKDPKNAIFRINRDIRFSKDKTPYNTEVKAAFVKDGRKSRYPGYYLAIGADKIYVGGGLYGIEKDDLIAIRSHIAKNTTEFNSLLTDKNFKAHYGEILGEQNKRIPIEYKELAIKLPVIANKQFYYMAELKASDFLAQENLPETIIHHFKVGHKLNAFLSQVML